MQTKHLQVLKNWGFFFANKVGKLLLQADLPNGNVAFCNNDSLEVFTPNKDKSLAMVISIIGIDSMNQRELLHTLVNIGLFDIPIKEVQVSDTKHVVAMAEEVFNN